MKLIQTVFLLFVLPLFINGSDNHEYYVSVTKIEYSKEQQSLQIISQVFINDFEKLLRERYEAGITLDADEDTKKIDAYMQRYLKDKLKIKVNHISQNFVFVGKEYKDDIVYCYLEIEGVSSVNTLEVKNRVLFDILPDQQNIVRLKLKGKNKSFLLIPDNDKCMLNFN